MNRALTIVSLVLSIAALVIAIFAWLRPALKPEPAQVRLIVDAELQRREHELVTAWAPKFRTIYKDMLGENEKLDERQLNPKTFADLFSPLLKIVEKMQQGPDLPPQK